MGAGCSSGGGDSVWHMDSFRDFLSSYSLHNLTPNRVAFAVYYSKLEGSGDVTRCTDVIVLEPQERRIIGKPSLKVGYARKGVLYSAERDAANLLDKVIPRSRWKTEYTGDAACHVHDLELQHALIFYEARRALGAPLVLHLTNPPGYTAFKLSEPLDKAWQAGKAEFCAAWTRELEKDLPPYLYSDRQAHVRYGTSLPQQEVDFVQARLAKVRTALAKFLEDPEIEQVPLDKIPRIGIACSGGGYRAMLASLGVMMELERAGVLDCVLYTAGLSGGAWLVSHLYANPGLSVAAVKDNLKVKLGKPFYGAPLFPETVEGEMRERVLSHQHLGIVDEYAWHLKHAMYLDFPTRPELWNQPRLSEQVDRIAGGKMPMPLYTAVTAESGSSYRWIEWSPYEAGIREDVNSWVPTWAFGRKFQDGASIDKAAEPSLAFMAGVFGSAFCATVDAIAYNTITSEKLSKIVHYFLYEKFPNIGNDRLFTPALFSNPFQKGPLSHLELLSFMDAGCDSNIPLAPLIRPERQVDIIFALDQSGGRDQFMSSNLELAAEYARRHKWGFPDVTNAIKMETLGKTTVSAASEHPLTVCLGDTKNGVASVLYFSLQGNKDFKGGPDFDPRTAKFCSTENWLYTPEQVDQLTGLTAFNTAQSMDAIKNHFRLVLETKKNSEQKHPSSHKPVMQHAKTVT